MSSSSITNTSNHSTSTGEISNYIDEEQYYNLVIENEYVILKKMGQGSYASVWLCYNINNNKFYASKIFEEEQEEEGEEEIEKMKKFKNEKKGSLLQFIDKKYVDHDDIEKLCIIQETLSFSLYDYIKYNKVFTYEQIKNITKQIIDTCIILKEKYNYIHGDLKPENILYNDVNEYEKQIKDMFKKDKIYEKIKVKKSYKKKIKILQDYLEKKRDIIKNLSCKSFELKNNNDNNLPIKIIDYGHMGKSDFNIQTIHYQSPEVILETKINEKCDVWSIGCIIYELLTGKVLFNPIKDRNCRNRNHLYDFYCIFGPIPNNVIEKSNLKKYYYNKNNTLKGFGKIKYTKLTELLKKSEMNISENKYNELINILYDIFEYDIDKRINFRELLKKYY